MENLRMAMLYIFSGTESYIATTVQADGANLPLAHGPWKRVSKVSADDPRLEQGMGKGTLADIRAQGYSLRRIVVTFEPSTTVPTNPESGH
jgi:hypothetical protein